MPSSSRMSVSASAQISSRPVPVRGVARQTGHLQAQDNTGAAHADFGDELLKTLAVHGRSAGLAEIGVDDDDLPFRPSQRDRTLAQRILPRGAFGILEDLAHRRLTHVQIRVALEMNGSDLLMSFHIHEWISCIRFSVILARICTIPA